MLSPSGVLVRAPALQGKGSQMPAPQGLVRAVSAYPLRVVRPLPERSIAHSDVEQGSVVGMDLDQQARRLRRVVKVGEGPPDLLQHAEQRLRAHLPPMLPADVDRLDFEGQHAGVGAVE